MTDFLEQNILKANYSGIPGFRLIFVVVVRNYSNICSEYDFFRVFQLIIILVQNILKANYSKITSLDFPNDEGKLGFKVIPLNDCFFLLHYSMGY